MKSNSLHKLFIAPDILDPSAGGRNFIYSNIRKSISYFFMMILKLDISISRNLGTRTSFLTNSYLYDKLLPISGNVEVIDYTAELINVVEKEDFKLLHEMADRVEELSLVNEIFAYKGVSLAKVHEIRWIWPIGHSLGFANLMDKLIVSGKFELISSYGINKFLPASLLAAEKNQLDISLIFRISSYISGHAERFRHRQFLSRMFNHYLGKNGNYGSVGMAINNLFLYNKNDYYLNKKKLNGDKKIILVIINFDRTLERFEKLIPLIQEMGYSIHVLSLPRVKGVYRLISAGIDCSIVGQWYNYQEFKELYKSKKRKLKYFTKLLDSDEKLNSILSNKFNLYKLSKPALLSYIRHGFKGALLSAYVSDKCIDAINPALILGFEDWDFNRSCNIIAKKKGMPSLGYYVLSAPALPTLVRRTHDYLAVSGANLKKAFMNQYDDNRIRIIGDPSSQDINKSITCYDNRIRLSDYGLDKYKHIVLLLLTYPYDGFSLSQIKRYVTRTFDITTKIEGSAVIIKAHPAQSVTEINNWLKSWGCPTVPIFKSESLRDLCEITTIVSAPITSAVFEVMSFGLPIVCLQDSESLKPFDAMGYEYLQNKGVKHIPMSENDHEDFIKLLLPGDERERQIQRGYKHAMEHSEVFTDEMKFMFKDYILKISKINKHEVI